MKSTTRLTLTALFVALVLLCVGGLFAASKADEYRYALSLPDLDQRIREIGDESGRAWDLANTAHNRIAQIERMGQQGRVVIPDTLNVRLTKENDND